MTNCHRAGSENTLNGGGGKIGSVCTRDWMCARKRQRKKFHKLKRLSVFVSMATGHTTAHLCIVITHYPQSHRLFLPCLFLSSIAKAKGGEKREGDRQVVITIFPFEDGDSLQYRHHH